MQTQSARSPFPAASLVPAPEAPEGDLMVLNYGPQHPSTHGVFRTELYLDGETVVRAVPHLGYLHRGVEKLCERLTWVQLTPIFGKNDYVAPMTNEQTVVMAAERLLGVEVPRRARYLRSLYAEMQRVASHLLWLGTFAIDLGGALGGGTTVFMYCFRERDLVLDLFEEVTGSRFHYNTHAIGGMRHDVPEGWLERVLQMADTVEAHLPDYESMTLGSGIFEKRTRGVGVLQPGLALELGVTGPNLRACGVAHDLRLDAPHHAYDEIVPELCTAQGGDCYARTVVRMAEVRESLRLVRALVQALPEGPLSSVKPAKNVNHTKIPTGQAYVAVEGPRGEVGAYVIAAAPGTSPYRFKIRAPSLHALSALPYILPGHVVADAVAILGSLDPIMGEVDR